MTIKTNDYEITFKQFAAMMIFDMCLIGISIILIMVCEL